jgi:hypothetical protein
VNLDHEGVAQPDGTGDVKALNDYRSEAKVHEKWRWQADYFNYTLTRRLRAPELYLVDLGPANYSFGPFAADIEEIPVVEPWSGL